MILLFYLFLVVYSITEYFALVTMLSGSTLSYQWSYLWRMIVMLLAWLCTCVALWKYAKIGKWLFTFCVLLSFYMIRQLIPLFSIVMEDLLSQMIRVLFSVVLIGKCLVSFGCMYRIHVNSAIRCIWKSQPAQGQKQVEQEIEGIEVVALLEQQLKQEDEEEMVSASLMEEPNMPRQQKESKLSRRAKYHLRKDAFALVVFLYGSLIVFYLLMFVFQYYSPDDVDGIAFMQRTILLSCLYTAMLYSFPAIGMFLYKKWVKYIIVLAWILELIHIVMVWIQVYQTVQSQNYGIAASISFLIMELIRYGILMKITLQLFQNPFIKAYWRNAKKEGNS